MIAPIRNHETPDPEILLAMAQESARATPSALADVRRNTVVDLWDDRVAHLGATGEWVRVGTHPYEVLGIEAGHGTDGGLFWARLAAACSTPTPR